MDKLIELINEYEEEWIIFDEVDDEECFVDVHPCTLWTEYNWHLWFNNANKAQFDKWMFDRVAISKDYGFIKRLVDNDKIEENNLSLKVFQNIFWGGFVEVSTYEVLLMLLATSDTPIEDLISYLK